MDFKKPIIETCDARERIKTLPRDYIDCIVTSPPYYNQRTYTEDSKELGKESSPIEYITNLADFFNSLKDNLKSTGNLFVVIGDKQIKNQPGLIPERFAWYMKSIGWILVNKIIWHKPNPMPESVKRRCTISYEHVFWFAKDQKQYYSNMDAIKTDSKEPNKVDKRSENRKRKPTSEVNGIRKTGHYPKANRRDVWSIPVQPYHGSHTATFPIELARLCILVGCPENGTVFDPFLGSGTTLLVAQELGRYSHGLEINPDQARIANQRLAI